MNFKHFLFCYHLAFSIIFHVFIMEKGGDAFAYWNLTADTSQHATTWGQYWGLGTFFLQWLNYFPSEILDLPFWAGNLLFGFATSLAWIALYQKLNAKLNLPIYFQLIWLMPNMHFWTSGVGKESLIWIFLVIFLIHFDFNKPQFIFSLIGLLLMFVIRPIYALFLLMILIFYWVRNRSITKTYTWIGVIIISILSYFALEQILKAIHIESLSLKNIKQYIEFQRNFLKNYDATSYVSMQEYSFFYSYFTALFKPLPWDGKTWIFVFAGLENILALVMILGALIIGVMKNSWSKELVLTQGIIFFLMVGFIGALILNNFGIMMRYKAPAMIFFYLWTGHTIFLGLNPIFSWKSEE